MKEAGRAEDGVEVSKLAQPHGFLAGRWEKKRNDEK